MLCYVNGWQPDQNKKSKMVSVSLSSSYHTGVGSSSFLCFSLVKKMYIFNSLFDAMNTLFLSAETDLWLLERMFQLDLTPMAPSPIRYCTDSVSKCAKWRRSNLQCFFWIVGGSGYTWSIFIYSLCFEEFVFLPVPSGLSEAAQCHIWTSGRGVMGGSELWPATVNTVLQTASWKL